VMGYHQRAVGVLGELVTEVESGDARVLESFLRLELGWARIAMGSDPMTLELIEADAQQARRIFEAAGDATGLAHGSGHGPRPLSEGTDGGDGGGRLSTIRKRPQQLGAQWMVAIALKEGSRSVEDSIERCQAVASWRTRRIRA